MMKIGLIYPYNEEYSWLLGAKNKYFDVIKGVVPSDRHDSNGDREYLVSEKEYEDEIEKATGIWIIDSSCEIDFEKQILPKVKQANDKQKQIIYTRKVTLREKETLLSSTSNVLENNEFKIYDENIGKRQLLDLDIPVVLIAGLIKEVNSLELFVKLKREFEKKQYKVLLFSDDMEIQIENYGFWLSANVNIKM